MDYKKKYEAALEKNALLEKKYKVQVEKIIQNYLHYSTQPTVLFNSLPPFMIKMIVWWIIITKM